MKFLTNLLPIPIYKMMNISDSSHSLTIIHYGYADI